MPRLLISLDDDLHLRIKARAAEENISAAEFVRRAVNQLLGGEVLVSAARVVEPRPVVASEPVFVPIAPARAQAKPDLCGTRDHLAPVNKCSLIMGHSGPHSWQA